jgi:hypothetical protein
MLRKTYTILAIAMTASACGGATATSDPQPPKQEQEQTTQQELTQLGDELASTSLADALARRDHFSPLCDADGYPLPGNINNKEGGTTVEAFCEAIGKPKPATQPPPPPQPQPQPVPACDRDALNAELSGTGPEPALAEHAHFRCLCDDKGYPLVGNINSKGLTASAFCSALREKGLL